MQSMASSQCDVKPQLMVDVAASVQRLISLVCEVEQEELEL